jgi:hypothetical protein
MWIALLAALSLAVPTPEEATAALQELDGRAENVGFVFFLDSSQTVEKLTEALRGDIADLVHALPPGDQVTILAFHTRPYLALPRTKITNAGRGALVAKIRTLDLPGGFDRDLGDGLDQLAAELSSEGASTFQHVIGVSNFCHSPTTMSEWGSGARGCSPIRNQSVIGKQVKALVEARRLSVRWFPIRDTGDVVDVAGADAARREFGGEIITDAPATWLQNLRARLVAERPRPLAAADSRDASFTLTTTEPDAEGHLEVTVVKTARVLDLELEGLVWTGLEGELPDRLTLEPSATFPAQLRVPEGPLTLFRRSDSVMVPVTLRARGKLGPAAALSALALDDERRDLRATAEVRAERTFGPPPWASALVLLALFAGTGTAAVLIRGRMMPLRLGGKFNARYQGGPRLPVELAALREAAIVLSADGATARLGAAKDAALILRVRRPVWQLHAEVQILHPDVEINGKRAAPGTHAIVPCATSFRAGDWRLTWE